MSDDVTRAPEPSSLVSQPPVSLSALAVGMALGFGAISLTNAVVTPFFTHAKSLPLAFERDVWDFALNGCIGATYGLVASAFMWVNRRSHFRRSPSIPFILHGAASVAVVHAVMGQAIEHQASSAWDGAYAGVFEIVMLLGTGLGIAAAHGIGLFAGRRRWTAGLWALLALIGAGVNTALFRDDFFESHSVGGWAAAAGLGGVAAALLSRPLEARPKLRRRLLAGSALTLFTVVIHPSNRLRLELFRSPAALGAWAHASTVWTLPDVPTDTPLPPEIDARWLEPVEGREAVPPSSERLVDGSPIIVMITIDAVRADVLLDDKNDALWPNLARLKRTGAFFTNARSPGSQTAVSLSTLFSGRYFSELYWSKHGVGNSRFDYPAEDPTPRFPALLTEHGVETVKIGSIKFLANDFGVASGFESDVMAVDDRRHAFAAELVDPLIVRLRNAGGEPLFLYTHLMEPHAPYDRGARIGGTAFERYEAEIGTADRALGRVLRAIASPDIAPRVLLVVSADHGEAFGEHGTFEHTKTLYEELVRVPLLVMGPHVVATRIAEPVSLIDLGPTILDVFGVDTPSVFMGQSLVGALAGHPVELTRPIFAEGRLRRSLVAGRIKVISDTRRKVLEGFDLVSDPGETVNLYDEERGRVIPALSAMQRFYAARSSKRPGYSPVYKP